MTPKALATTTKIDKLDLTLKSLVPWGNWVAQSVKRPTLAQVLISWFVSSSPALDSAVSTEPTWDLLPPSLSVPFTVSLSLSLSKKKINKQT